MKKDIVHTDTVFILTVYTLSVLYIALNAFVSQFSFIDEVLCVLLFVFTVVRCRIVYKKEFQVFALVVLLYLIYSLIRRINVPIAAARDFFQFMKPFFCFYAAYYAGVWVTERQRKRLRWLSLFLAVYLYCLFPFINSIYLNTTSYYHACTFAGVMFLLSSDMRKRDLVIFMIILLPGLVSFRSKFVAEIIIYAALLFYVKRPMKLSLKLLVLMAILAVVVIWANFEKFSIYFITGYDEGAARTYMYYTSFEMLGDYFPFGSGFGTFGTDASGRYYSPLYYKYGLNFIYGCRPDDYQTDHSFFMDTFFPVVIGQFGIIGTLLFIKFWMKRLKEASLVQLQKYKLFMIAFVYMGIESIASSSFLGAPSVGMMMTMGLCLNIKIKNYAEGKYNSSGLQRREVP